MNAGQRMSGVFGAVFIFFGAMLPVIQAPLYGGIPLLQTNVGGIVLIAAIVGAVAALIGAAALVRIATAISGACVGFFVFNYYTTLGNAGNAVSDLESGLGGSFGLSYGLWVVILGIFILGRSGQVRR